MKIEERLSNYLALLNSDTEKSAAQKKLNQSQSVARDSDAVNVEFSPAASRLADEGVRLDKLNSIRQRLAEGSYNISGKDVAEKMLKILQN